MSLRIPSQDGLWEVGVAAVANAFAGTVYSTVFNVKNYKSTVFLIHKAVGATGTATITVEGCTDTSGTGATAVPFRYRVATTLDTFGDVTLATTSGFTTTAGSNQLYEITVDNDVLGNGGFNFIRLKSVEVVASAVLGGVIAYLGQPRYPQATQATALS